MINLNNFLKESKINESKSYKIVFNNLSALFLYNAEISGQISDGYWENSRPYDHWKWINSTEVEYDKDGTPGRNSPHKKKYSLDWMSTSLRKGRKDPDWAWTKRFLNYGKFGRIYPESKWKDLLDGEMGYVVEFLPEEEITVDELAKKFEEHDWMKKYWDAVKSKITEDILKKYYSTKYDRDDLEDDLDAADKSLNGYI